MRSQIKLASVTVPPTAVEAELAALCNGASQTAIAEACGLSCHTTISERLGKALMGRKGFLSALTGEQVVRLAAGFGPLAEALRRYLNGDAVTRPSAATIIEEVRQEITEAAALIGKLNEALADGKLTNSERADLILVLRKLMDRTSQLIAHLEASMRQEANRG